MQTEARQAAALVITIDKQVLLLALQDLAPQQKKILRTVSPQMAHLQSIHPCTSLEGETLAG